jgi:hypothetical protein
MTEACLKSWLWNQDNYTTETRGALGVFLLHTLEFEQTLCLETHDVDFQLLLFPITPRQEAISSDLLVPTG